jgi:Tol biopolymer transport system component
LAKDTSPDWSPDGKRIVFASNRDEGNFEIYVMNADGSGQKNLTKNPTTTDIDPSWSPSGKQIAFERNGAGVSRDIFRMRADGSRQVNLTETGFVDADVAWQPRPE